MPRTEEEEAPGQDRNDERPAGLVRVLRRGAAIGCGWRSWGGAAWDWGGVQQGVRSVTFRRFVVLVSEIYNLRVKQNVTRHWTESAGITIRHFFLALLP